jgi:hypothetical protein
MDERYPIAVEPIQNHRLRVTFDNNESRIFDVTPYLDDDFFAPLHNEALFNTVKVTPLTVEWAGGIDIAPEELYLDSRPC